MKDLVRRVIAVTAAGTLLAVAGCTDPGPTPPAEHESGLPGSIAEIIEKPQYAHAAWGMFEIDTATSQVSVDRRAQEMFIPGSTAKIFSISSAWEGLGPDSKITTPVYTQGTRSGGRLNGDLILVGAGDVTFGGRTTPDGKVEFTDVDHVDANFAPGAALTPQNPLAGIISLAKQVRAAGITEVSGDVVVDDRLFTSMWNPEPTPIMINDNTVDVTVRPGAGTGVAPTLQVRPLAASYTVQNTVRTVAAGEPTALTISGSAPGQITITGTIAADADPQLQVAPITDPAAFGRTVFIQALEANGVRVGARPTGANPVALLPKSMTYPAGDRVAAFESPTYAEQARLIMKVSLNLGANLAVCLLAVKAKSNDCEDGFAEVRSYLTKSGVDVRGVALSDGRGGDLNDRATPIAVDPDVAVLGRAARFRPVARRAADPRRRWHAGRYGQELTGRREGLRQDRIRRRRRSADRHRPDPGQGPGRLLPGRRRLLAGLRHRDQQRRRLAGPQCALPGWRRRGGGRRRPLGRSQPADPAQSPVASRRARARRLPSCMACTRAIGISWPSATRSAGSGCGSGSASRHGSEPPSRSAAVRTVN